jgi:cytoskeletal protein CcmA (bactofilin family)
MRFKWIVVGLLALLLAAPATAVLAQEPSLQFDEGRIFVDEDVSLEPGEIFQGDMGVFDGDLDVPEGAVVEGDVFVTGGHASISGKVNGSLAVLHGGVSLAAAGLVRGDMFATGGDHDVAGQVRGNLSVLFGHVALRSTAVVDGDLLVTPGTLDREAGAQVRGDELHGLRLTDIPFLGRAQIGQEDLPPGPSVDVTPPVPPVVPIPEVPPEPRGDTFGLRLGHLFGRAAAAVLFTLAFLAMGALVVLAWPRQTRRVADCIGAAPAQSLGLGLLTFLLAGVLEALAVVLMVVIILFGALLMATVILIPLGLLLILLSVFVLLPVPLALIAGMVLGWVGLAEWLGRKVLGWLKVRESKPLGSVVVGLLLTVPVAALFWVVKPGCCGWPFMVLLTSVGLGAVFHTRFGRQECGAAARATVPAPGTASSAPATDAMPQPAPQAVAAEEPLPAEAMAEDDGRPDAA